MSTRKAVGKNENDTVSNQNENIYVITTQKKSQTVIRHIASLSARQLS
jgi:IS30 family transposase